MLFESVCPIHPAPAFGRFRIAPVEGAHVGVGLLPFGAGPAEPGFVDQLGVDIVEAAAQDAYQRVGAVGRRFAGHDETPGLMPEPCSGLGANRHWR